MVAAVDGQPDVCVYLGPLGLGHPYLEVWRVGLTPDGAYAVEWVGSALTRAEAADKARRHGEGAYRVVDAGGNDLAAFEVRGGLLYETAGEVADPVC